MSTATTIAVTVLLLAVVLIALAWKARGVGPLVLAGVVLGAAAGISATLLAAGLT
ncbi:hypothetical protein [Pseudonocardia broussonetiae]|jgi:hypothetical protein|uniref:Uncharacterized protein n=1 Tax=Pseudonocardia broussonetiae TaxID=2736640 RepID=A0A6M6JES2_9PSEU|nr:hypothetical protein [Pseudonocardia broussonetiae]QJY45593.1 hypothetical protein HOP40_07080 [Pseudonocardia broussonetiae]